MDLAAARQVAGDIGGHAYAVDIRSLDDVERLAEEIEREHGPVYALVVSSGAFQERCAPADMPLEIWRKIMDVNLDGTFFANRALGTRMAHRSQGSIVNIASTSAYGSTPLYATAPARPASLI